MFRKKEKYKKFEHKNLKKGSGILVVVLSAITFSIYVSSAFLEVEHFGILLANYENDIKEIYEKNINNIEDVYERIIVNNIFKSNK